MTESEQVYVDSLHQQINTLMFIIEHLNADTLSAYQRRHAQPPDHD